MTDQSVMDYRESNTMSPRPDVSTERKSQILNAAEQVFTKKGFDQSRMDDIAEETGLSKGTLYLYFKSKDDLIVAVLDRIFLFEFNQITRFDHSNASALEEIWNFSELITKDFLDMMRIMPIAYEFLALAFRNKIVQKALKQYMEKYMEVLIPIIQRGIDNGEFKKVDPKEAAIAIGAVFEGTVLLWVYDHSLVDPKTHIRSGMKLILEGLQARD